MPGVGVSRWTMAYFGAALVGFVAAQAAVAFGWAYPAAGLTAPATLATVHVVTVGWLTVLILGALHQFVPVITARPLTSEAVAGWALVAVEAGLAAMVAGFLGLSGGLPGALSGASRGVAPTSLWLPVGGSLVVAGVTSAAVNLARNFWRARPLPLAARFVAAGLGFLVATVLLGLVLALALAWPGGLAPDHLAVVLARGLPLHLLAGIGGWFTLTAMGVAYKLLAMFTLAPEDRGAAGRWAFDLTAGGLALAWLGGVAQASSALAGWAGAVAGGAVAATGWAAALVGAALYLGDMARLFRQRRRRELELNARFAAWALGWLGAGLALAAVAAATGRWAALAPVVVYAFLFGWLSGLGLSQLYKIVPFLTWIERYGPRLGRGPVPRVQDLVDEGRARPWFAAYFAATGVGAVAGLAGWPGVWRWAVAAGGAASLGIVRELWLARRARPAEPASAVSRGTATSFGSGGRGA